MDYEKLHKDTINRLQQMVSCGKITVEVAREICADFELESEDERIRKELIRAFKSLNPLKVWNGIERTDILAWLEKQREHKLVEWSKKDDKIKDLIIKASDAGCLYGYVDSEHLLDWLNSIKFRCTQFLVRNKDIKILNDIIQYFEHERNMYDDDESKEHIDIRINWLKYLKDRVFTQPKQEWSEEDKDAIDQAILALEDLYDDDCPLCRYDGYKLPYDKAAKRLKSLKDRVQPQPKQEWSKEDEDMLYKVTAVINRLCAKGEEFIWSPKTLEKLFYWLQDLRTDGSRVITNLKY